jgi:hypothetical protein
MANVSSARRGPPMGSVRVVEMRRVGKQVREATRSLDDLLENPPRPGQEDLHRILKHVREARRLVDQAFTDAELP